MKQFILKSIHILFLFLIFIATSCDDDFPIFNVDFPEGEGVLTATVTFTPATALNIGTTRTPGDSIKDINSLCVLVYSPDGKLIQKYTRNQLLNYTSEKYTVNPEKDYLDDGNEAHADETTTAKATFSLPGLPFGQYKIYAVANMGDLSEYDEKIKTEDGLKTISLNWKTWDIPSNNQMFGYFTPATSMESTGFDAPILNFRSADMKIHAWLKRAASKVTVAFDPSGLKQGVTIYIRNVTIRDIPKTCYLGAVNTPTKAEDLYNYIKSGFAKPDYTQKSFAEPNTRFEYNRDGIITNANVHTGDGKTDGFVLDNSIRSAVPADAHDTDQPSLFFYENNQNKAEYKGNPRYDKQQHHSGQTDSVGVPIRDEQNDKDYKDRVPLGTYIEVEAYYISDNPERVGEGSIKYRFMLGKDAIDNYDAQRNYHFKVTLGFNGWANDPDWHIDYELPSPGIEVPPVFRVSYLYHQKSELPIRILGACTDLQVEITENNWAPYDPNSRNAYQVPNATTSEQPNSTYEFKWNYDAFEQSPYMVNGKQVTYFGFLCLHLPDRDTTTVDNYEFSDQPAANNALKAYYEDNKEGERSFKSADLTIGSHHETSPTSTDDDDYEVKEVTDDLGKAIPNQKTLLLPVWTRAKTLITGSGFSGNNPYEGYERKATLHITATFAGNVKIEKEVTVLQVKRLVNPKGVWRDYNRNDVFNVTLLEAENANGMSNFQPFTSEGEWMAYIDGSTNAAGFSLSPNGQTNGYIENGVIHGYTGSTINFAINFGASVGEDESECAIVKVLYHGNQCLHKILIRKGYSAPIRMGGRLWSSFSLYKATWIRGNNDGYNDEYNAVLTKNPLMLGSMFRRGMQSKGILVKNNQLPELAPFLPPNGRSFLVANDRTPSQTWSQISYRNDVALEANRSRSLGTFYADGRTYKVPTYEDWDALTKEAEFGYGVVYGSAASEPATTSENAYGLIDPDNTGEFTDPRGMRGIIAYNKESGDQIFFPVGKYGTGRRTMFNIQNASYQGVLRYADVYEPLSLDANGGDNNNLYRPIPYNLPITSGNIYWTDVYKQNVHGTTLFGGGCLGWDLNYFNFDFNAYTANNYQDACPIKFIIVE